MHRAHVLLLCYVVTRSDCPSPLVLAVPHAGRRRGKRLGASNAQAVSPSAWVRLVPLHHPRAAAAWRTRHARRTVSSRIEQRQVVLEPALTMCILRSCHQPCQVRVFLVGSRCWLSLICACAGTCSVAYPCAVALHSAAAMETAPKDLMLRAMEVAKLQKDMKIRVQSPFIARCIKHGLEFLMEVCLPSLPS